MENNDDKYRLISEQLDSIVAAIPDMMFTLDTSGVYCDVFGQDASKMVIPADRLLGKSMGEFFPAEDFQNTLRLIRECIERHTEIIHYYHLPVAGKEQFFEARFTRYSPDKVLVLARNITETKLLMASREEEISLRQFLFESSRDGLMIFNTDHRVVDTNLRFCQMLGYSPEELKTMHTWDFEAIMSKEDIITAFPSSVDIDKTFESKHRRKDGSVYDVEVSAKNYIWKSEGFVMCSCRDITERKSAEEQLRKLSQAVEQSPASVVVTNLKGDIEYVNPKFCKVTGYTLGEAIGQNPRILKSGELPDCAYKRLWDTITSGLEWRGEFHNKKKNGELYWEFASISPIRNDKGDITHFVAVKEDITEQKRAEEKLIQAKEIAEENNRLKTHFLTNMSHEIRTPMNGILGFMRLLQDIDLTSAERNHYISLVNKSGHRLLETINDIMEMSKIESGHVNVNPVEINVAEIIHYLFDFFRQQAKEKGLKFSIGKISSGYNTVIITDKHKLESILSNLLKNAIKFTSHGGIEFGSYLTGNSLTFYVTDTGMGIPADRLEAIFDRFVQADLRLSRPYEGSGLGLSISKAYAELIGGNIRVTSVEGEGSTFYVTIPKELQKNTQL